MSESHRESFGLGPPGGRGLPVHLAPNLGRPGTGVKMRETPQRPGKGDCQETGWPFVTFGSILMAKFRGVGLLGVAAVGVESGSFVKNERAYIRGASHCDRSFCD